MRVYSCNCQCLHFLLLFETKTLAVGNNGGLFFFSDETEIHLWWLLVSVMIFFLFYLQADVEVDVAAGAQPKKRTFKKFSFRGVDLDALLDMSTDELVKLFSARARRRFQRGLTRKPMALIKKLRKAVLYSLIIILRDSFVCVSLKQIFFRFC